LGKLKLQSETRFCTAETAVNANPVRGFTVIGADNDTFELETATLTDTVPPLTIVPDQLQPLVGPVTMFVPSVNDQLLHVNPLAGPATLHEPFCPRVTGVEQVNLTTFVGLLPPLPRSRHSCNTWCQR
jgi:hypothetical protein